MTVRAVYSCSDATITPLRHMYGIYAVNFTPETLIITLQITLKASWLFFSISSEPVVHFLVQKTILYTRKHNRHKLWIILGNYCTILNSLHSFLLPLKP